MIDPGCMFSHVRIIENTKSRVVVQWRSMYIPGQLTAPPIFLLLGEGLLSTRGKIIHIGHAGSIVPLPEP